MRGDAGDPAAAVALVEAAVASFGRLDVLCGHAGLTLFRRFPRDGPGTPSTGLVATNLRGTYFTAQAAARRMVEQGEGGRIVLTSSVTAHRAIDGGSAYAMTKAGIEALATYAREPMRRAIGRRPGAARPSGEPARRLVDRRRADPVDAAAPIWTRRGPGSSSSSDAGLDP